MRVLRVVCALVERGGRILATQRGYGEYLGRWEFPGGKIEPGETPEEALIREIREELTLRIEPVELLAHIEQEMPGFRLSMDCFLCAIREGTPVLVEHEAARWLLPSELDSVDWLPADRRAARLYRKKRT